MIALAWWVMLFGFAILTPIAAVAVWDYFRGDR